jgi:hypothetical protein
MRTGREAKNKKPGVSIPKRRYRFTPVIPIPKCASPGNRYLTPILDKTRAALTVNNLLI